MKDSSMKSLIAIVLLIPGLLFSGLVIKLLWGWFIVPLGVIPISIIHAIGIDIVVSLIAPSTTKDTDNMSVSEFITYLIKVITKPLTYLLMGFIVKLFM